MSAPLTLKLTRHELFSLPRDTPAVGEAFRVEVSPRHRSAFWALARVVLIDFDLGNLPGPYPYKLPCVFFRDEARPSDEIFISTGQVIPLPAGKTLDTKALLKRLAKNNSLSIVTRCWQRPDLPFGLCLTSDGEGRVNENKGQFHLGSPRFHWGSRQDEARLWEWNTRDFHKFCRAMVVDPASPFNFLVQWEKLAPDEKTRIVTRCEHGDWNDLLRLFTWALQLITHRFGTYQYENRRGSCWHFSMQNLAHHKHPATLFACRWQNALFSILRPAFWPREALCQAVWRLNNGNIVNSVRCEIPTQHEVLEAELGLREFLRPHLSEQEIEALFSPV